LHDNISLSVHFYIYMKNSHEALTLMLRCWSFISSEIFTPILFLKQSSTCFFRLEYWREEVSPLAFFHMAQIGGHICAEFVIF
jgi:hypothetical protein